MSAAPRLPRAGARPETWIRAPVPRGTWHALAEEVIVRGADPHVAAAVHAVVAAWRRSAR